MAHTVEDALIWWGRPEQWFWWSDLENKTYKSIVLEPKILRDGVWIDNPYEMPTEKEVNDKIAEMDLNELREVRNQKLTETDWVVIKEREEGGSVSNFADWKTYRQALRDITKTYKTLEDVKWPTVPTE
jgi:hypothetical protein